MVQVLGPLPASLLSWYRVASVSSAHAPFRDAVQTAEVRSGSAFRVGGTLFGERGQRHSCGRVGCWSPRLPHSFCERDPGRPACLARSGAKHSANGAGCQTVCLCRNLQPQSGIYSKGDFPGGPMAKTPLSQCWRPGFHPQSVNCIPHAATKSSHATTRDPTCPN